MFIEIRDTNGNLKLLNINHIISVEESVIPNYKVGEADTRCAKITSIGAMVSSTQVYETVEKIRELINKCL